MTQNDNDSAADGSTEQEAAKRSDVSNWAAPVERLRVSPLSPDAENQNVEGRRVMGPVQGFGQLWRKTITLTLSDHALTPKQVVKLWKEQFPSLWPKGNRFYTPIAGIAPGEVATINVDMTGGMRLATGVMVIYADEESFAYMTPEGHSFSGWITFSAEADGDRVLAKIDDYFRCNDPIYEFGFRLGGNGKHTRFWESVIRNLGERLGGYDDVTSNAVCIDRKVQWSQAKNVWRNSMIRTTLYRAGAPLRWAGRPLKR